MRHDLDDMKYDLSKYRLQLNKLYSAISKHEGKKSEVSIGNIREVIKTILDLEMSYRFGDFPYSALEVLQAGLQNRIKKMSDKQKKKMVNRDTP